MMINEFTLNSVICDPARWLRNRFSVVGYMVSAHDIFQKSAGKIKAQGAFPCAL
jgi:hypothetical protein